MRRRLWFALFLTAAGPAVAAEPPRPVSNTEVAALSDAELIKLAVEQAADFIDTAQANPREVAVYSKLTAVLGLEPGATPGWIANQARDRLGDKLFVPHPANEKPANEKEPPTRPLQQIELLTKPYAVATSGLCRTDIVVLSYNRAPSGDASTLVMMRRLLVIPEYHALKAPKSPVAQPADAAELKANAALCSALDVRKEPFAYVYNDDAEAVRGLWLLDRIGDGLKQKVLPFELVCDRPTADKCRTDLAEDIKSPQITDCKDGANTCTIAVGNGSKEATVTLEPGPLPKIKSISVHIQIMVQAN
jgi:hypothetical protein